MQPVKPSHPESSQRQTTLDLIFTLCIGFHLMQESNTIFFLIVSMLSVSLLLAMSTFLLCSQCRFPLGNFNLPQKPVYCAFYVSMKLYSELSFSYVAPALWNTLEKKGKIFAVSLFLWISMQTQPFPQYSSNWCVTVRWERERERGYINLVCLWH